MPQKFTHYVDFPISIATNGAVVKINFGTGDDNDNPDAIHTIAMASTTFMDLTRYLSDYKKSADFQRALQKYVTSATSTTNHDS